MGDTALDITNNPLAIEGLEDLLVVRKPGTAQGSAHTLEDSAEATPGSAQGFASGVPVDEAARRLGISPNAVLKRLRKGKLRGQKVSGQFGDHWLVDVSGVPEPIQIELEPEPGTAQGSAHTSEDTTEATPGSAQGFASGVLDRERDLLQLVVHLSKENGALQALLTEREQQLKLLTDSQHKRGWWSRFGAWFMTGRR
ncbi:MAG: hypothetical protein C0469_00465 [Cyanobacteria bacterium DS2.3.42]|nr:hypothetical protein [Cyanobacteria bacterium DS2.3.42]